MKALLQHIKQENKAAGTVLFVGATNGRYLAELRDLGAQQTILTEAHPTLAEELSQRARPANGETVWPCAITPAECTQATLHVLNNPRYSSTATPAALLEHLPNLRVSSQIDVPAKTMAEALNALKLSNDTAHGLIMDAPGQAAALLKAADPEMLQGFSWMMLSACDEPLYEDEATQAEITQYLADIGFHITEEGSDALFPYSRFVFKRNEAVVASYRQQAAWRRMEAECAKHLARCEQLQEENNALRSQLQQTEAQIAALEANLCEANTKLTTAGATPTAKPDEQPARDDVQQEPDVAPHTAAKAEEALHQALQQRDEYAGVIGQLQSELRNTASRQQILQNELIKAEAQIELIKDLLLREPEL